MTNDCLPRRSFGINEKMADELLSLVLSGKKTASSASLWAYEAEEEPLPVPGAEWLLTGGNGLPACLMRTENISLIPFHAMTFDLAAREGEDDGIESWQKHHIIAFTMDALACDREFSTDMPVVFEEFSVVDPFPLVRVTREIWREDMVDSFIRTQPVTEVWRKIDGAYRLVNQPFTDDWTPRRKREKARELISDSVTSFAVFHQGQIVGLAILKNELRDQRMILDSMQVSRPYRGQGLGRRLFARALEHAAEYGAKELYISACSSRETIAFYRAMGADVTDRIFADYAEDEPCDLQMTCPVPERRKP